MELKHYEADKFPLVFDLMNCFFCCFNFQIVIQNNLISNSNYCIVVSNANVSYYTAIQI